MPARPRARTSATLSRSAFVRASDLSLNRGVDQSDRYIELARRGREAFLRESAPAALVRRVSEADARDQPLAADDPTTVLQFPADFRGAIADAGSLDLEIYPLSKKPGAAFSDMITVGRTANNDIPLNHVTVSRFHAYFKSSAKGWVVADQGSKNGTTMSDSKLDARREVPIASGSVIEFGEVRARFLSADELYNLIVASE